MKRDSIYDIDTTDEALVKRRVIGLAMDCPINNQQNNCPLKELRKYSFEDRIKKINEMDHKTRVKIYLHHRNCLSNLE